MRKIIKKFGYLLQISVIKTIMFNIKYFNLNNAIKFPVIISKNFKLHTLKGSVELGEVKFATSKLGFGNVGIFDKKYDRGIWQNNGIVKLEKNINIGHGVKIVNFGELVLGDSIKITANSQLISYKRIEIGSNTIISWDNLIMDTDFHKIKNFNGEVINQNKDIIIGKCVWIGCRCLILKGSKLPNNSVIAAGSIINKDLFENKHSIIFNSKVVKNDIYWVD
ncbi:acyltransferase [Clostridium perfringens]|uniref:acyltransferase n=1 Tax=Clostridium perfringens TaxID=1502 RepID=UPI0039EC0336